MAAALAYALPLMFLLIWNPMLAVIFIIAPLCFLLVAHGPAAIAVLIVASSVFIPITQGIVLLPADLVAFVLVAAYLTDLSFHGSVPRSNRLARPYLIYVLVMLFSISLEGFTAPSVRYFTRQVLLFLTFLAVAHFGRKTNILHILIIYVLAAVGNSLYSLGQFLGSGGTIRTFGLASVWFGDHAVLAFLISSVFYIWSRNLGTRILWGTAALLTAGGILATQIRGAAITAGWGLMAVMAWAFWKGHRAKHSAPVKNLTAAVILLLLIVPILIFYTHLFEGIAYRFGRIGLRPAETILERVTLWKAAFAAFWRNPVLGIGTGNFTLINQWVPDIKFSPFYHAIAGLSTHNVFLGALVETGLAGFFALIFLFIRAIRISYRNLLATVMENDLPLVQSLFIISLIIMGSSIYAGYWFWANNSYHMAVFFGLIASYKIHPEPFNGARTA